MPRLRDRPDWPPVYVAALEYIDSYGAGGPVNPELRHHLYHDLPAPAEVISLDEILVSEDDLGLAA
jgi:hypothetical protein